MIKERLRELVSKLEKDDVDIVEDIVNDMSTYVKNVVDMENAISISRFRLEGQDYRDHITSLDTHRRVAHNAVIVGVKLLNRLCKLHSVEEVYTGNIDNRNEVGDFCLIIVNEMFKGRELAKVS